MADPVELVWTRRLPAPPERVWAEIVDRLWRDGAGMPPRPRMTDDGDAHGIGATRAIRILPGVELVERITAGRWPSTFAYQVVNPGWTTFPARWHQGTVALDPTPAGGTEVQWSVTFEPLPGARLLASWLTRAVIGRYLKVLQRVLDA
jgi:hypothetical protein